MIVNLESHLKRNLKSIEISIKKHLDKFLSNDFNPQVCSDPVYEFSQDKIKKILILRHDRIGDLLISTPFLNELRKNFPSTQIDILLSTRNESAKRAVEAIVNKIYTYKRNIIDLFDLILVLNRRKYDLIIDLFDNASSTSNIFLRFVNSRYKLGFDKENWKNYTHILSLPDKSKVHPTERLMKFFDLFGTNINENPKITFPLTEAEILKSRNMLNVNSDRRILGINLSGSDEAKNWGEINYSDFIKKFRSNHPEFDIVLFTTRDLKSFAEKIASYTESLTAPFVDSFKDYAGLIAQCDLLLTPDTSAVHLCSAFGLPCVCLYTYVDESFGMPWYPIGVDYRAFTDKSSIMNIAVDDVLKAFGELITNLDRREI